MNHFGDDVFDYHAIAQFIASIPFLSIFQLIICLDTSELDLSPPITGAAVG